jgi:hypothetical protein
MKTTMKQRTKKWLSKLLLFIINPHRATMRKMWKDLDGGDWYDEQ